MALPGIGTAIGVAAKFLDRFTDPRRRKDVLLVEREQLLAKPQTPALARRLERIDADLLRVQREIDRRSE